MLVLTRVAGEKLFIGNDIVIEILETGHRVRLGFTAPAHVRIMRPEALAKHPDKAAQSTGRQHTPGLEHDPVWARTRIAWLEAELEAARKGR